MDQRDEMTRGVHEWRIAENEGQVIIQYVSHAGLSILLNQPANLYLSPFLPRRACGMGTLLLDFEMERPSVQAIMEMSLQELRQGRLPFS